jgi:hypothetical protein
MKQAIEKEDTRVYKVREIRREERKNCIVYRSRTSHIKVFGPFIRKLPDNTVRTVLSSSLHSNESIGIVHDVNCGINVIIVVGELKASYLEM